MREEKLCFVSQVEEVVVSLQRSAQCLDVQAGVVRYPSASLWRSLDTAERVVVVSQAPPPLLDTTDWLVLVVTGSTGLPVLQYEG